MAIQERDVSAISVEALLEQDLRIPPYQRPYSWEPATALRLFDDIQEALDDTARAEVPYVLGAVILHDNGQWLDVVDGQQRLLTLRMMLTILESENAHSSGGTADNPISRVRVALRRRFAQLEGDSRTKFWAFVCERCQMVRVVTNDVDEAFRVFDSQNYRGKPLAPHDLLKAHHLREMQGETAAMKAAVVETWESVRDADLDRLFSTYLYRIARWSRGESAPRFSTHDIEMFKGVSPEAALTPSARYHLAAQAAIPMLDAWGATRSKVDARDAGRSRFQLDAPLMAGRPFFEMVSFMLQELKRLAEVAFEGDADAFGLYKLGRLKEQGGSDANGGLEERPSQSRYRYVAELYLAALLYYTNKFGEAGFDEARDRLFAWAYAPRVELLRVQFRSVDNRGRGEGSTPSAFGVLRNSDSGKVIRTLPTATIIARPDFETELVELLKKRGAF